MSQAKSEPLSDNASRRFSEIYRNDGWTAGSGTGSKPENSVEYVSFLSKFLRQNDIRTVVDFGCGDWQFSQFIDWSGIYYTGIDVVSSVIRTNQLVFGAPNISFKARGDLDAIPVADLLICKDVFQHLPNEMIEQYLQIFYDKFKWLLITNDDHPDGNLNGDIEIGQWRAVRLDMPPFSRDSVCLLSWIVISNTPTVRKRTTLIRGNGVGASAFEQSAESSPGKTDIPRRIFQTWKVRSPLPKNFEAWSQTIKDKNPSFEYVLWDDADNRSFISEHFGWFLEKYDSYDREILRVDAVRYFALFYFGGFYMDLDVECFGPLDRYLSGYEVLLGRMGSDPEHANSIPNAIMASSPRQEFWLYLFSFLLEGPSSGHPELVTGPEFLKKRVDQWNEGLPDNFDRVEKIREQLSPELASTHRTNTITVLPAKEWFPVDWTDPLHQVFRRQILDGRELSLEEKTKFFNRSVLGTYWTHSW